MIPKAVAPTFNAKIYIAGDIGTIRQVCREYCFNIGFCVTVTETEYIYKGGAEPGAIIGLINYPRFPATSEQLDSHARALGELLMERCCQTSFTVEGTYQTQFFSRRPDDVTAIAATK